MMSHVLLLDKNKGCFHNEDVVKLNVSKVKTL